VQTAIFIPQRKQANAVGAVHIFAAANKLKPSVASLWHD